MSAYNTKNHPLLFYHQREIKKSLKRVCFNFNFFPFRNKKIKTHTQKDIQRNDQSYPKNNEREI